MIVEDFGEEFNAFVVNGGREDDIKRDKEVTFIGRIIFNRETFVFDGFFGEGIDDWFKVKGDDTVI